MAQRRGQMHVTEEPVALGAVELGVVGVVRNAAGSPASNHGSASSCSETEPFKDEKFINTENFKNDPEQWRREFSGNRTDSATSS